jgi:phage protein D
MRLTDLEKRHGGFYVPAYVVKVGGNDVLRDLCLAVTSISVDLKEKTAGTFSFTVSNAFDWESQQFVATQNATRFDVLDRFRFGSTVEIRLGYGDVGRLPLLLSGVLTGITTAFESKSAPELVVTGFDDLYPLTVGSSTRHWEDKPDSAAVQDIARAKGVSSDVRTTTPVHQHFSQNNENDMAFVAKLAARNGATFYERSRKLYFGPRQNDRSETVELEWGQGLLSFSPDANLARQVGEVKVYGRSVSTGDVIVGAARRGQESGRDARARSGGERLVNALAGAPVLSLRAGVRTQAEADARAKAVLEERAESFLTGTGESIGLPEVLPDTNVAIDGLGPAFSKTYYVSQAIHRMDRGGYNTTFHVQETTV